MTASIGKTSIPAVEHAAALAVARPDQRPVDTDEAAVSDEVLAQRLAGGDSVAGETLVKRYQIPLMRESFRLVGSEHIAEELFQQTWLSVLDHIERFNAKATSAKTANAEGGGEKTGGGFKPWLFRIAVNKATDVWRSRGREKAAKQGLQLTFDEAGPDAGARIEGSEQQEKLKRAIEQLPENQRQVLMLRFYSEMKFVEIADVLGCPLNTALGRMHKAILKLKQLMEK